MYVCIYVCMDVHTYVTYIKSLQILQSKYYLAYKNPCEEKFPQKQMIRNSKIDRIINDGLPRRQSHHHFWNEKEKKKDSWDIAKQI